MTSTRIALCLVATTLFACGSSAEPGKDWSKTPLDATVEGTVKGVAFKVSVPKGWVPAGDMENQWRPDVKDYFSEPDVTVRAPFTTVKTVDDFVGNAMLDAKDVVGKKAQTADGFVLVTHTKNNGTVRAFVLKAKGEAQIVCEAEQAKTGGVPSPDATMAWLEQLCSSLTLP